MYTEQSACADAVHAKRAAEQVIGRDVAKPTPAMATFLSDEHDQLSRSTAVMRRVEELADRICGSVPTEAAGASNGAGTGPGLLGELRTVHEQREQIRERTARALSRIEDVL